MLVSSLEPKAQELFKQINYVNDHQYVKRYIETMMNYSENKLRRRLFNKRRNSVDAIRKSTSMNLDY